VAAECCSKSIREMNEAHNRQRFICWRRWVTNVRRLAFNFHAGGPPSPPCLFIWLTWVRELRVSRACRTNYSSQSEARRVVDDVTFYRVQRLSCLKKPLTPEIGEMARFASMNGKANNRCFIVVYWICFLSHSACDRQTDRRTPRLYSYYALCIAMLR